MLGGILKDRREFKLVSLIGIGVVIGIIGLAGGLLADNTTLGRNLEATLLRLRGQPPASAGLPQDLNYQSVEEVYDKLRGTYEGELNESDLIDGLKKGLAAATGDPYTVYFTAEEAKEFNSQLNNEFSGIGAEIDIKNQQLQVITPLEGTPAMRAGLRPGDLILAINGEDTSTMFLDEAISKIGGPENPQGTLTIARNGRPEDITITRAKIEIPNAKAEVLDGNIGYLKVNTFGDKVTQETQAAAKQFRSLNVRGVILDLRGNGGGFGGDGMRADER